MQKPKKSCEGITESDNKPKKAKQPKQKKPPHPKYVDLEALKNHVEEMYLANKMENAMKVTKDRGTVNAEKTAINQGRKQVVAHLVRASETMLKLAEEGMQLASQQMALAQDDLRKEIRVKQQTVELLDRVKRLEEVLSTDQRDGGVCTQALDERLRQIIQAMSPEQEHSKCSVY